MPAIMNQTHLHPYSRSVSIIGVGCTPFMYTLDKDETNGLSEGEMFGYAALKAMEDAGIRPKDVEFYIHGEASPLNGSDYITPNMQVANWFGMKGKASIHHSEACCTGYHAVELAVEMVASGKYNCVLSGCVEFGDAVAVKGHPWKRTRLPMDEFLATTRWLHDRNYTRPLMSGVGIFQDDPAAWYKLENGLTDDNMDDALNHMSINNRKNASVDELALERRTYEQIADEHGFDDVMAYMRSPYNPKMGEYLRVGGMELKCDGAAAVIVVPTDMVSDYTKNKGVEVLGTGAASLEGGNPHVEVSSTMEAVRQVYELTGIHPEELDLFYANDFIITSHLISAEIAGYLPKGEGWKYVCEGRTAYDGDKPINTNGGRTSFGHAHAASGLADFYEAVMQMRGNCKERQVRSSKGKTLPKTAMLRGFGGAQNVTATIIRIAD